MDDLLQKAIAQRDALRREMEILDNFIHAYMASALKKPEQPKSEQTGDLFAVKKRTRSKRAAIVTAMMDEVERAILEEGRPLTRTQLLERLEHAGHKVEGTDKSKVLGTNLWRSRRFYSLQSAGYWPKSKPIPEPYTRYAIRDTMLS